MSKKKYKKLKRLFISLVFITSGLIIYVSCKNGAVNIVKNKVLIKDSFNENNELVQELNELEENYLNLYGEKEVLTEIKTSLDYFKSNLDENTNDELEKNIINLRLKINSLSAANELDLENKFNEINNLDFSCLNESDQDKVNKIILEFTNLFKQKKYRLAKEKLEELDIYKNEAKELNNEARIERVYEEASSEDPSTREPKYVNDILVVNKEFGLPSTFAPGESYEARQAFEKMKIDAASEGIYLEAFSTYRSYWAQESLYWSYVNEFGQSPTDTFSARAGFSEHQTGLAFDIGGADKYLWAEEDFKYTDEAKWLKENCTKYGFILRYPEGKERITGYMYESWHFRYIGIEHSKNFANNDLTLEEYLGLYK